MYSKPTVNTHTQNCAKCWTGSYFPLFPPLLSSLHLFLGWGRVRSQGELRAGTSLSAEAGLAQQPQRGSDAAFESSPPCRCRWLRLSWRTIIPLCSRRAESQLCPVNLNLWHKYSGCTYCCMDYKGIRFQRRGRAGKDDSSTFSVWEMLWIIYLNMLFTAPPQHWFSELQRPRWFHFNLV